MAHRVAIAAAGFLSLMVFLTLLLRYELEMGTLIAGMLSVSVMAVGFMLALALQHFLGLSLIDLTLFLGGTLLLTAMGYETVT